MPRPANRGAESCWDIRARTLRIRSAAAAKSTSGEPWIRTPKRALSASSCEARAARNNPFEGTHPKLRQSPPSNCLSTSATLAPRPAVPAPTTTRLYLPTAVGLIHPAGWTFATRRRLYSSSGSTRGASKVSSLPPANLRRRAESTPPRIVLLCGGRFSGAREIILRELRRRRGRVALKQVSKEPFRGGSVGEPLGINSRQEQAPAGSNRIIGRRSHQRLERAHRLPIIAFLCSFLRQAKIAIRSQRTRLQVGGLGEQVEGSCPITVPRRRADAFGRCGLD